LTILLSIIPFQPHGTHHNLHSFPTRRSSDLSLTFFRDHVFARHPHVGEFHDAIVKRTQAHEVTAISDLEPGRIDINNERSDLLALLAVYHFRRRLRHHHQHTGLDQIGAPKFFTI